VHLHPPIRVPDNESQPIQSIQQLSERTLRLPDGEKGNMHDAFEIDGNSLKLAFNPEDLLIAPDPKPMVP
jgi:hypothetical protein